MFIHPAKNCGFVIHKLRLGRKRDQQKPSQLSLRLLQDFGTKSSLAVDPFRKEFSFYSAATELG